MTMQPSTAITGRRLTETTPATIQAAVGTLLAPHRDALAGESVLVVPDVHYPYHPSTGLVSHPDVVAAVVAEVRKVAGPDVAVGCRSSPVVETDTALRILGYHRLAEQRDLQVVQLDAVDAVPRQASLHDGEVPVSLPRPLDEAAVVVVPTLRTDPETGVALGMATLARTIDPDATTPEEVWAAVTLCSPAVTLLDGSYTYLDEPRRSEFLLAGSDIVAVDAAVARAVGRSPSYLDERAIRDMGAAYEVEGLSLDAATGDLPTSAGRRSGGPDRLMRTAYRWYARLAGDGVPPQFLR